MHVKTVIKVFLSDQSFFGGCSGLFSSTMRELSAVSHDGPKWIVLDGDIDPMWIESLNTVMDDNKVWNNDLKQ